MLGWRLKAHDKNHAKWLSCNELILVALLEETFQDKNLFNFSIGANDHKVELEAAGNFWVVGNALFSPLYTGGDDLIKGVETILKSTIGWLGDGCESL